MPNFCPTSRYQFIKRLVPTAAEMEEFMRDNATTTAGEKPTAERLLVSDRLETLGIENLNSPVKDLIGFLDEFYDKYPEHVELYLETEGDYHDECMTLVLYGKRPETNIELQRRLDKFERSRVLYERSKARREAKEKDMLDKLKNKYETAP